MPYARNRPDAALDLSLFAIRTFRVSTLAGGLSRIGVNAVPFMLPLLFQIGFGLGPVQSGSLTFVSSLGTLVVRPVSARLMRRFGYRGLLSVNGVFCAAVATNAHAVMLFSEYPISTPTAAGMTAPKVGTTLPMVEPLPRCTSGMTARCL